MGRPVISAKGAATRDVILARAVALARLHGLDGLTIGALADDVGMSKSGLFAHFGSREELQLAALEVNGAQFLERVLGPALEKPRGLARLRTMMTNWFEWIRRDKTRGGCVVAAAVSEYDDQPGPVRDRLVAHQSYWREQLARAVKLAIETKELDASTDPQQLAFELNALAMGVHHDGGLFDADLARKRALAALERILRDCSPRKRRT